MSGVQSNIRGQTDKVIGVEDSKKKEDTMSTRIYECQEVLSGVRTRRVTLCRTLEVK